MLAVEESFTPLPEQVADAIPALVSYVDTARRYRFVNSAYSEWFGHERSEIEDRSMVEVLGEAAYETVRPHVDAVLAGEPQQFEAVLPYKDAGLRRVEVRYVPDRNDELEVRGFYVLVVDRSAADFQERRIAELERRQGFLLEVADTLWGLEDPEEIMATAARLLGERLELGRSGYCEIAEDDAHLIVRQDWTSGVPSLAGVSLELDAFGPELVQVLREGRILRVDDIAADPRSAPFAAAYAAVDLGSMVNIPLMRGGRLQAFFCAATPGPRAWTDADVALAQDVAARTWSSLARARSERALRESEARFRDMADCAPAPVWVTGAAGPMEFANEALAEFVGRPVDQILGDVWIELMHPQDAPTVLEQRAAARAALVPYVFDARFRHACGEWRWLRASCRPRFDASGGFKGYVGIAMDVTETRRAEERQRLLINELNHRVKNTLATVQSLAHQTLREGMVSREARAQLTERLLALSAAHNVLTRENWEAGELGDLAREAVRPYDDPQKPRIEVSGPPVRLAPNVALAISMALHELATNAVKYGALSSPQGAVALGWTLRDGAIELEWRETGGPPVAAPPERKGFGSRLLSQGLAAELGAPAELAYPPEGLVCRMRAPAAEA